MSEKRTITIEAYRDTQGRPTCCAKWPSESCIFLKFRRLGTLSVCIAAEKELDRYGELEAIKPLSGCIVWRSA